MRIFTFSSDSFVSVSASTSAEPCTSALMMIGSSLMPPSAICSCSDSSVRRPPRAPSARSLACAWRNVRNLPRLGRVGDRLERIAGLRQARRDRALRPASTGRPTSPAARDRRSARGRVPTTGPAMKLSPTFSVPSWTSTVATGPRPRSSLASSTAPDALRFGLALSSRMSVDSRIISSS